MVLAVHSQADSQADMASSENPGPNVWENIRSNARPAVA